MSEEIIQSAKQHNAMNCGGTFEIELEDGYKMAAPIRDWEQAIEFFQTENEECKPIYLSAKKNIDKNYNLMKKGQLSQKVATQVMQDIVICRAYESVNNDN